MGEEYAFSRRGLARDGEVALGDAQRGLEVDRAGSGEHDRARRAGRAAGHALARTEPGITTSLT